MFASGWLGIVKKWGYIKLPRALKPQVGEHGTPEAAVQALMAKVQKTAICWEIFFVKESCGVRVRLIFGVSLMRMMMMMMMMMIMMIMMMMMMMMMIMMMMMMMMMVMMMMMLLSNTSHRAAGI